jgi:AraC family transcriptional regulator
MTPAPEFKSVDCTNEAEMNCFGAKLLQHRSLSQGVDLLHYDHSPAELPKTASQQHLILINTKVSPDTYIEQVREGKSQKAEMKLEDIIILPAQIEASARWNRSYSYLALCLSPTALEQKVGDLIKGYSMELLPQFALCDPLIYSVVLALQQELSNPGFSGQLYLDSLLTTLDTHLLRHYSTTQFITSKNRSLTPIQLQQAIAYIRAHLERDLSLDEIARVINISPSYFANLFKDATGISPYQYVIQQRVEKAKSLLLKTDLTIADIALQVGFCNQSHLTRRFKRLTGETPKKFRRS